MVANEQFNLMIAAQDYPDIFGNFNSLYTDGDDNGIEEEIILALEDYEDLFPHYQKYRTSTNFLETATTTAEGHVSGFYELMSDFIGPFFGMMGRGDWIEELGMGTPETYDELHELLLAMKDKYGCTTAIYLDSSAVGNDNFLAAGYGIACMLATNAKESYWMVQDGTVVDGITGEGYKEYLTMLHQWYQEGLISKDFADAAGAMSPDGMAEITSGNCGVFFNGAPMMSMYSANSDDPNLRIVGLPDPVKEKGEKTHVDTTEFDFGAERMSISTKCENPEIAIQYCDFWFTDEGIQLANYGVEGESCEVVNGVAQFTDLVLNNPDLAAGDAISFYTGRNSTPSWSSNSKLLVSYNEDEAGAFEIWASCRDNRDAYPYVAQLTQEESYEISKLASDYETYALECRDKFIVGTMDIEKEYEAYEEGVRTMGLTRALEIKQAAYDRYMEK
jgi:putative aldouronate transport system substrate-binding protein